MNQQYDSQVETHRQQNIQMRIQLAENSGGETSDLYQQSLAQLSHTRQLIIEINERISQNPSDFYLLQDRDDLVMQLARESEASGFIRAFLPPES